MKSPRGQQRMLRVVNAIEGRYAVTFHDKKYALACKFFEYIFEPALQRNSKFFCDLEFNKFVANVLYAARVGLAGHVGPAPSGNPRYPTPPRRSLTRVALIWDSPVTGEVRHFTYGKLRDVHRDALQQARAYKKSAG